MSEYPLMPPRRAVVALALLLGWAGPAGLARAGGHPPTDPVAVASTSTADYARGKFGPGGPRRETYVFFQGKFYGGAEHDANLDQTPFTDIARVLAENLVRQNYLPTRDRNNADLLIVVHWGQTVTDVEANYNDDNTALGDLSLSGDQQYAAYAGGKSATPLNPGPINAAEANVDGEEAVIMKQVGYNADLLGFTRQFAKDAAAGSGAAMTGAPTEVNTMLQDLQEPRYFVILMAYDQHSMKKGATPRLLWSTRFSIRAPGNTFTAALPVMARVASDYFGHAIDGLKVEKPSPVRDGSVDVKGPTAIPAGPRN